MLCNERADRKQSELNIDVAAHISHLFLEGQIEKQLQISYLQPHSLISLLLISIRTDKYAFIYSFFLCVIISSRVDLEKKRNKCQPYVG